MIKPQDVRALQGKIASGLGKKQRDSKCLYVNSDGKRCPNSAIFSHTIQKNGALRDIAETGHVYRILPAMVDAVSGDRPLPEFKKIGLSNASVFPGFCNEHDHKLFDLVEKPDGEITRHDLLFLGYRSICMELFKKERSVAIYNKPDIKCMVKKVNGQRYASAFVAGTRLAIKDLERQKTFYENVLNGEDGQNIWASYFTLEQPLPFCYASSFAPEFNFDQRLILPSPDKKWDSVSVFAGNIKGRSILAFVGLNLEPMHDVPSFFETQENIPLKRVGGLALHMAIEYSENTYFNITWSSRLLPEIKADLFRRFGDGVPGMPNSNKKDIVSQFDIVNIPASDFSIFPANSKQ